MTRKIVMFFVLSFVSLGILSFNFNIIKTEAAFDCLRLTPQSSEEDKSYCRNELSQIEAQLAELLEKQKEQQKQTGTLKGDVNYLTSQINALKTKIKARGLAIARIKVDITEKQNQIGSLASRIEREHASLAKLVRNTNEFDDANLVHLILSDDSVSDFYGNIESYASLKQALKDSVDVIRGVKKKTEIAKKDLEIRQDAETDAKAELENAQKKVAVSEAEKKNLLAISQNKEAEYQRLAAEKKARADRIRSALFPLANTSSRIDFGTALQYANEAKNATGVDPAFLLAVITQESNLGANVGQCYLTNTTTGAGAGKNTGTPFPNVMKPMGLPGRKGDIDDFLRITAKLGRQWNTTAVSCPIPSAGGYGGAMGPAQFIPSTWSGYESRLRTLLGHDADPWNPRDAFFASAMLLTDKGAVGESAAAQQRAACSYYGTVGATCGYATSVMRHKATIQANIDLLQS